MNFPQRLRECRKACNKLNNSLVIVLDITVPPFLIMKQEKMSLLFVI